MFSQGGGTDPLLADLYRTGQVTTGVLFSEVLFVLLLAVVEAARLLSGWKGNLTESAGDCNIPSYPELPILAHTRASCVNGLSQIPYL